MNFNTFYFDSDVTLSYNSPGEENIIAQFEILLTPVRQISAAANPPFQIFTHSNNASDVKKCKQVIEKYLFTEGTFFKRVFVIFVLNNYKLSTMHNYTLYTIHYTLCTIHYTLCTIHYAR